MANFVNYRFRLRRALAATWAALNDILLDGELGWSRDDNKLKIGDGATGWNDLDYLDKSIELSHLKDVDASDRADGIGLVWNEASQRHKYAAPIASQTTWILLNSGSSTISSPTAPIEVSLVGYNEVLVVFSDVTLASSGLRGFQVSADAGATWPHPFDYVNALGVRGTDVNAEIQVHNTASALARSGMAQFSLTADAEQLVSGNKTGSGNFLLVPALSVKPNRIKVGGWTTAGSPTNMTGGNVFIYAR